MIVPSFSCLSRYFSALSPCICQLCSGESLHSLCNDCLLLLQVQRGAHCEICDLELPGTSPLCADCIKSPPSFSLATCAYPYTFPVDHLIQQFKDHYGFQWGKMFSKGLALRLYERYEGDTWPTQLIPVPLHWTTLLKRGYNQSALIAEQLSQDFQIPCSPLLKKVRKTSAQHLSNAAKRKQNLSKSFTCKACLEGQHVAIVDDVLTTGATAKVLSKILIQAGASRVDVWALARTPKSRKY